MAHAHCRLKVLLSLDGTPSGHRALPYAAALVKRVNGELIVIQTPSGQGILPGIVERHGVHLIAMADTPGSFAEWSSGRPAEQVLREMQIPVLLIPEDCQLRWLEGDTGRLLVPLDGSSFAEDALVPASQLARLLGTSLLLIQVVEPLNAGWNAGAEAHLCLADGSELVQREAEKYLAGIADRLEAQGTQVEVLTAFGRPAMQIAAAADQRGAAAIVMATHGRSGLTRLVLGSVASGVIRQARVPVLLLPPPYGLWRHPARAGAEENIRDFVTASLAA